MIVPLWVLVLLLLLAQALLLGAKLVLVAGYLDEEQGLWIEAGSSLALTMTGCALARPELGDAGAALAGVGWLVIQLVCSRLAIGAGVLLDLADEDAPLPLDFVLLGGALIGLIGFGLSHRGGLLAGLGWHYAGYLLLACLIAALTIYLEESDPDAPIAPTAQLMLSACAAGGLYLAARGFAGPGRAMLVSVIAAALGAGLQALLTASAARLFDVGELDLRVPRSALLSFAVGALAAVALWGGGLLG